jgi:ketosteroid isomerase-like protein
MMRGGSGSPPGIDQENLPMAAAENLKLMQDLFARIAAGDRTAFNDCLADDVVMRVTGHYSWSQTFVGKAAVLRDLYGYLGTLVAEGRRTIPLRFIAGDDHVVVEARGEMRTKAGVPYNNEYCLIYRLKDGKIVEFREYCDSALTEAVLGKYPAARAQA